MFDNLQNYAVEIDVSGFNEDTPVSGSGVDGLTVKDVKPIGDCMLTPGDGSPVGRCPETGDLVYLDRPKDRARDAALPMLSALEMFETYFASDIENGEEMNGADTVDSVVDLWNRIIKPALASVRGETRTYPLAKCDACGESVSSIVGCPDGREVCQHCFDNGEG